MSWILSWKPENPEQSEEALASETRTLLARAIAAAEDLTAFRTNIEAALDGLSRRVDTLARRLEDSERERERERRHAAALLAARTLEE